MTATSSLPPPTTETRPAPARNVTAGNAALRWMLTAFAALFMLSIVRAFAGGDDLTSSGTTGATVRLAAPILLAGLGGLVAERAGVINIGLEGMMILGTWTAAFFGFEYGVWVGLLAGFLAGALGGLLHAIATVSFGVDHIVSGVAINLIAPGLARFLAGEYFPQRGGSISLSPQVTGNLGSFSVPFLAGGYDTPDALGRIEEWEWFFVSDVGGNPEGRLERAVDLHAAGVRAGPGAVVLPLAHPHRAAPAVRGRAPVVGRLARRARVPHEVPRRAALGRPGRARWRLSGAGGRREPVPRGNDRQSRASSPSPPWWSATGDRSASCSPRSSSASGSRCSCATPTRCTRCCCSPPSPAWCS